jgi:hypothetical protein
MLPALGSSMLGVSEMMELKIQSRYMILGLERSQYLEKGCKSW